MRKFVEHHCIVWNDNGWKRPSGRKPRQTPNDKSYAKENGFGHEEWNGSARLRIGDWRTFHSAAGGDVLGEVLAEDRLCIVLTSRNPEEQRHYLVGIAIDVSRVDKDFRDQFDFSSMVDDIMAHKDIWERHRKTEAKARKVIAARWRSHGLGRWLAWKCLNANFWWAPKEIVLAKDNLSTASGDGLTWRSSSSQPLINPTQIAKLLVRNGCKNRRILSWLTSDEFAVRRQASQAANSSENGLRRTGSSSKEAYWRYLRSKAIEIRPMHTQLQRDFECWLQRRGFTLPTWGQGSVDIIAERSKTERWLIEVKPASTPQDARFAVRLAVGQLLEYRWLQAIKMKRKFHRMVVVSDCKPDVDTLTFSQSIGVRCAWRGSGVGAFTFAKLRAHHST